MAGVCQRTGACGGAALSGRAQWHQLQHCPQLWAGDRRRHSCIGRGGRRIRHERASLSAPSDRLVPLASAQGAVAVAAGKIGAGRYFGRSLRRALAINSNCAGTDLGDRDCRRFSLSTDANRRARPPAWRRSNLRRHAGGVWHGRSDRSAQYFYASRTFGRRRFDPSVHDRHGRLCRRCRGKPLASTDWKRARLRGRRLDGIGHAVQCRRSARRPALGRRSSAGGLSGGHHGRDSARQLDVGQHSKRHWGRGSAADLGRRIDCFAIARLLDADANGHRP